MPDTLSPRSWIRVTFLGWLLGIVIVIALAFLSEMFGIRAAQLPVGLGMGLGVGILQERALRPFLGEASGWPRASALGLALPFLVVDIARLLGTPLPYSLYPAVAVAGIAAGGAQASLLRPLPIRAAPWILASGAGWAGGAFLVATADSLGDIPGLRGIEGAILYLTLVAMGGIVLGATTSVPLRRVSAPVGPTV
jgi:hypothetical protein